MSVGPLLVSTGCGRDRELTRMQGEVNRAATELVIQDAQARREWMEAQQRLDEDRRQLAKEQRRDPIIAQAILQIGGLGLCLLPLWLIARLLKRSETDPVFHPIDDMVFDELIGHSTPLLPCYERDQPPDASPGQPQRSGPLIAHRDLNALIDDRLEHRRE
ncbi:MAG TPA: hypothetical protein DDZ51_21695 [Planctomycetaceae bacterium]|nr:hypothetical protein [Planctomycetaceae bacterium]